MLESSNIKLFGERLKNLREKKYKEAPNTFAYCQNQEAFCVRMALHLDEEKYGEGKSISRQTLGRWESGTTYPYISMLPVLCKLLDCDPNYLLGNDNTINQEVKAISAVTGLNHRSVEELRTNKNLVKFINYLLQSTEFMVLIDYIEKESVYYYLDKDLLVHFKRPLKRSMERAFSRALVSASPYDDILDRYKDELRQEILNFRKFGIENGILTHVNKDIENQIMWAKTDRNIPDNGEDCYNFVVDFLAEFSYQPLWHINESEQRIGRLTQMFISLLKGYFESEAHQKKSELKEATY